MITPKDIETKLFKVSLRGYNISEVDDFLSDVCDDYDKICAENYELKKRVELLSQAVGDYKSMEGTLSDAVSIAGRSAADISHKANKSAAEIIRNAEITAESIIAGAEQKIAAESYRLESIKREIEIYKAKIIQLLNAQLSVLKGYPQSGSIENESISGETYAMWNKNLNASDLHADGGDSNFERDTSVKRTPSYDEPDKTLTYNAVEKDADEKEAKECAKAEAESDMENTLDLGKVDGCNTDELPRISMNKDGGYTVTDRR